MGRTTGGRSHSACRLDPILKVCLIIAKNDHLLIAFYRLTPEFLAPWKKEAKFLRNVMNGLYGGLWRQCKERNLAGDVRLCLADQLVLEQEELQLTDHQIAFLLGVLLEGGSDTVCRPICD